MNEYIANAKNFLKSCNAKMSITFKRYDKHFEDDKDFRNVYTVRIDRSGKSFSFQFGNSVMNTVNHKRPTCYDILVCLQKYDVGTFENFISEFGYTIDSYEDNKRITALPRGMSLLSSLLNVLCLAELLLICLGLRFTFSVTLSESHLWRDVVCDKKLY